MTWLFRPATAAGRAARRRFRPRLEAAEPRVLPSTFTVTNTNDSGDGSLRRAILESNADPGPNTIAFNIPGDGVQVIRPSISLPAIQKPVLVDGYSQPGAAPNTAAQGDNATIRIVLDGSGISDPARGMGLQVKTENSTVRGLSVVNFGGVGVLLDGTNNRLEGSFVGVDPTGKLAGPNGLGVGAFGGGAVIGGPAPAARNVISGNAAGVGLASLALGGPALIAPAPGGVVQNNLIGTDATGAAPMGNTLVGVALVGSGNVVGGTAPGEANVIAHNGSTGAGVLVAGLKKEPDATIKVVSAGNLISGNAIYDNRSQGIGLVEVPIATIMPLLDASSAGLPSAIAGLVGRLNVGATPNVHLRPASGPNNFANHPELTSAVTADGVTTVRGKLDGTPRTAFRIQFFANPAPDPSGYGQGRTFLGEATVTTDADGIAPIRFTSPVVVPVGQAIAATATDAGNNTSPFSNSMAVTPTEPPPAPKAPPSKAPSTAPAPAPTPTRAARGTRRRRREPGRPVALIGRATNIVTADRDGVVQISGRGKMAKLGAVTITSNMDSKSQRRLLATPWLLHVDLTISGPKGDVNVRINPGTLGVDPFAQPVHLKYTILGGTGAYRNARGTGLADLRLYQGIPRSASGLKAMGTQLKTRGIRFSLEFRQGRLNQFGDLSGMWYKVIQTAVKTGSAPRKPAAARKRA